MKKTLIFYIHQNLMVVSATIESDEFIMIELLFPFTSIKADYYCTRGNFLSEASLLKILEFAAGVCLAYIELTFNQVPFLTYVENTKRIYLTETLEESVHRYLELQFDDRLNKKFFSKHSYIQLFESYLHLASSNAFIFQKEQSHNEESFDLENALKTILELSIETQVYLFPGRTDSPYGKVVTVDLKQEHFPDDRILQELIILKHYFVNNSTDNSIFEFELITKRFNAFTDQKRLQLFMICNVSKDLYLYNHHLTRWWLSRY